MTHDYEHTPASEWTEDEIADATERFISAFAMLEGFHKHIGTMPQPWLTREAFAGCLTAILDEMRPTLRFLDPDQHDDPPPPAESRPAAAEGGNVVLLRRAA